MGIAKEFKKLRNLLLAVSVTHGVNSPTQLPDQTGNSGKYLTTNGSQPSWATVTGGVTSVSLNMPALFNVSGSPITGAGTFAVTFANQAANRVFAGPTSGADSTPSFRALVKADLPANTLDGSLTSTRIPYASDADTLTDSANHTWDNTNNKVTVTYPGVGTTVKPSILLTNTTAATNGNQQNSPGVQWQGRGWKTNSTAASQTVEWFADVLPVQGTSAPYSKWRLRSSVNGGSLVDMFSIDSQTSTTLTYPKMNISGVVEQSFNLTYGADAITLINSNSSSGYTVKTWRFGSNDRASHQVESNGRTTFRTANNAAFDFQTGSTLSSTFSRLQVDSTGLYSSGVGYFASKVNANSSSGVHAMALNVGGGIGLKGVTIAGDTTLSNTSLTGGVYYCDTSGASTCSGTPSTSCSGYTYAQCGSHTTLGCIPNLTVTCSDYNYSSSSSCTSADAACVWDQGACSAYNNDSSGCATAGWPSGGFCSFTASTCVDFGADEATCNAASGCAASPSGSCSGLPDESTCNAYNSQGCTTNYGDCHAWDSTDQATCEATSPCSWDGGSNLCNGTYYSSCSGSYYVAPNDCTGTYSGLNGICLGSYDIGTCSGTGGTCDGTALCSNLTPSGSGVCTGYAGCSWVNGLTITLPSLAASGISTDGISPIFYLKKVNSGAGSCTISRASGTNDTIEGSTTNALTTQYDKLTIHGRYLTASCGVHTDNKSACEGQSGCSWPTCSSFNMNQETCEAVNGCAWSYPDCTGTVSPNGECSGSYVTDQKWYKF
jgi:hypothetical protein